jgi:hypothetical protein
MEQSNNNSMTNNGIDLEKIGEDRYDIRLNLNKHEDCKVERSNLDSKYLLSQEELSFLERFLFYDMDELTHLFYHFHDGFYHKFHSYHDLYYIDFYSVYNGIKLYQSSFEDYRHLADEDEIEEERKLYNSEDVLEYGFYAKETKRWQMDKAKELYKCPFNDAHQLSEADERKGIIEWLGCYFPYHTNNYNEVPEVHLFMDNITEVAHRLCVPRKYIVVAVFLHEMCHALFDRFPLLLPKPYIPEIEEPIAECLALDILYSFVEISRFFYPNGELLDIFDTAYSMVFAKRRYKKISYYSLGIELFHSREEICRRYHKYSYFVNKQSYAVKNYLAQFANGFPPQPYTCVPMLANLLNNKTK